MELYGLKTCDTCRKALKSLENAEFIDVRDPGVPPAVLQAALARFGVKVINTRSTTWRATDPLALLQAHPALMKRPLIVDGDTMYLGWTRDVQVALGV